MPEHTVGQGDCIFSIAQKHGLFWQTIWNHPNNAELKGKRKDPNVLYPGDVVFIPDKERKQESGATEQRHRFRLKGVPAKLRLRIMDDDEPRANESYVLVIDGDLFSGTTDADGRLEHPMPPDAKRAKLILGETQDELYLNLGHIDPIDEIAGVQIRLNNLGFDCGKLDGILGPETETALRKFQKKYDLTESGKADQATRQKLLEVHGC